METNTDIAMKKIRDSSPSSEASGEQSSVYEEIDCPPPPLPERPTEPCGFSPVTTYSSDPQNAEPESPSFDPKNPGIKLSGFSSVTAHL